MGTVGWVVLTVWLVGVVLATYPSYLLILKFMDEDDPDSTDKAFGGFIGFLLAGFWPVMLVGYVAFKVSRRLTNAVLGDDDRERTP